jgi:hypothetical protein
MDKAASSFDLIIDTIPVRHDFEPVTSCRGKTIRVSPARHFSGRTWCRGILA